MTAKSSVIAHQTRLFPKNNGANAYIINGIAAKCDWVVLSDTCEPRTHLVKQKAKPKFVFLSLRAPFDALQYFYEHVLPQIKAPFVLVSGSEDVTIPVQTDKRWRCYNDVEKAIIKSIQDHPLLIHWFAENLVGEHVEMMSPIPLGLVFPDSEVNPTISLADSLPLNQRPNTVFCAHRVREGEQWERRRKVSDLANNAWRDFCVTAETELPEQAFFNTIQQHSFVICVEGGGIDPSPKAWHVLMNGAIPIVCSAGVKGAYSHFPIVFVEDWTADAITKAKLVKWKAQFGSWFDNKEHQNCLLQRLGIGYWWTLINKKYAECISIETCASHNICELSEIK